MTMSFSALKVKLILKLLATDVRNFDDIVESRTVQRLMQLPMMSMQQAPPRLKMRMLKECTNHLMKELVERHLEVIRHVKLLNDCYSMSALVLVHATSFIAALTLPRAIHVR
ncbi:hypothetical protein J6590_079921 [Homalodisca vitripennis]|nr:hypothetical protein J6590_079921 [Homalodisca vitripennis]